MRGSTSNWLLAGFLLVLSVLFFTGGPLPHTSRLLKEFWNFGHILYFCLLPLLLIKHSHVQSFSPRQQILVIFGLTGVLGLLVELLQHGLKRSPDAGDMLRNLIGAMVAIFFLLPLRKKLPVATLFAGRIVTIVCLAGQCYSPLATVLDEWRVWRDFPVMGSFESSAELTRWSRKTATSIVPDPENPDNRVMRVQLTTLPYSRTGLNYFRRDWSGYTTFEFKVYNTLSSDLELHCRIHDEKHQLIRPQQFNDRFNTSFMIKPGWNTVSIPLTEIENGPLYRKLDLQRVFAVGIFVLQVPVPTVIYLDDVRLH